MSRPARKRATMERPRSQLGDVQPPGSSSAFTTTIFISNLHCPSCTTYVEESLSNLSPPPESVTCSIISHSVVVRHNPLLPVQTIVEALDFAGFDIHSIFHDHTNDVAAEALEIVPSNRYGLEWERSLEQAVDQWQHPREAAKDMDRKRQRHVERCSHCQADEKINSPASCLVESPPLTHARFGSRQIKEETSRIALLHMPSEDFFDKDKFVVVEPAATTAHGVFKAIFAITGMTCSACVGAITRAVRQHPWVRSVDVNLLTHSAIIILEGGDHAKDIIETIEDTGFDASLNHLEEIRNAIAKPKDSDAWTAIFSVSGMTCSSCVGNVTAALEAYDWITEVDVNLLTSSATISFVAKDHITQIKEAIEDSGYNATLNSITHIAPILSMDTHRSVAIQVRGMYCQHCPNRVLNGLQQAFGASVGIEKPLSLADPVLMIRYVPDAPHFTLRHIMDVIKGIDPVLEPSVFHPPTIEERARALQKRETRHILVRLALSVVIAIPTFLIGILWMDLMPSDNKIRQFFMTPMWKGTVSRSQWILFILATPVYLFAADVFHRRALKEIRALWRPGSRTPLLRRFYRFGSMNMLMSLGTTIAYFASIAELAISATSKPLHHGTPQHETDYYFDSVVFLTMFLLIGRFLEAYSKAKTGDAVTSLGKLRPSVALLMRTGDQTTEMVSIDLLDVGDIIRVVNGSSPPFDGIIIDGSTQFDESSLTGESRPVSKQPGDTVYSGTVNKRNPITVRLSAISGTSMLDQIIKVVREGQTRRAPIERVADVLTSHFVPFVVLIAIITWAVWLTLGLSNSLPTDYRDTSKGGWPLWSLRFAIAVFVVACPCGIGLAAPTALFVGGGLAAHNGILVKGGGEAFQEASNLDCIVFDKTGTLTHGGDPVVSESALFSGHSAEEVLGIACQLEESSGHPLARAIVNFCKSQNIQEFNLLDVSEVAGKGLQGEFSDNKNPSIIISALLGNEALMAEYSVRLEPSLTAKLHDWKSSGKSIALLATSAHVRTASFPLINTYTISYAFAISDTIRPEAARTIAALQSRGIETWMLTGDNADTANAIGAQLNIPAFNIIAGVLPDQKAAKIKYLQRSLHKRNRPTQRAIVAMVGDGINDSPALAAADIGIAIGSGSDVAISSAAFILVSSNLTSLLTLIDLSRAVFRRVWFNFGWALVYNLVAMPVAAGVLYPLKSNGIHVRLDPVWAALAMALSSVSVVCSSLVLRTKWWGVGYRGGKDSMDALASHSRDERK